MSIDEQIKAKIEDCILESQGISADVLRKINEIHAALDFLVSLIVAQQKDICSAAGIAPETLRRKILEGYLVPLSKDASRLNFVSIKQMLELKPRIRSKRKNRVRK